MKNTIRSEPEYLDLPLPDNWDDMHIYERQHYVQDPVIPFGSPAGVMRSTVSNMEIWSECFCRNRDELTKAESFNIRSIMECIPGWERTNKQINIPIYGKQRIYERTITDVTVDQSPGQGTDQTQSTAREAQQQMRMQDLSEFGTEFDPDVVPF